MKLASASWIAKIVFLIGCAAISTATHSVATERAFSDAYIEGMMAGKSDVFGERFAQDIAILPEYDLAYLGQDNAKHYYQQLFTKIEIQQMTWQTLERYSLGEQTLVIGGFTMTVKAKYSNIVALIPGSFFEVWENASQGSPRLLTLAWNFDQSISNVTELLSVKDNIGVQYGFQPTIKNQNSITRELQARNLFNQTVMLKQQKERLHLAYAQDAWFAHHDVPFIKGREAIKNFFIGYTAHWPQFDYVSVVSHNVHWHEGMVLEHYSYNLRWHNDEYSGVSLGKGIRLLKRNSLGTLETFRVIAMND